MIGYKKLNNIEFNEFIRFYHDFDNNNQNNVLKCRNHG